MTGGFVLKPDRIDVEPDKAVSESSPSLKIVSDSQKTESLGNLQGTQGINVGVKGRVRPENEGME